MNHVERFEQRWEFRRKEVDGDTSSDENGSNSNTGHKLVTDLVLVENDDADDQECQTRNDNKVERTKNESKKTMKKGLPKKKSVVNENERKRKLNNNETMTMKDLKTFANSLIHELSVTRENMFAHMRDKMRKLASSKSPIKKNVRRAQKNEKNEPRKTNKQPSDVNLPLVSPSIIPLPKPEFQSQRNGVHLSDHIPLGVPKINGLSESEIGKLMAANKFSHRIAELQPQEWFNRQNSCIQGIGFPVPFIQGTSNGSNGSSLTYCESSFVGNNGVGVRMNGRFPGWS